MCWTPLSENNTNNVNKTRALIQTTGGKDEQPTILVNTIYFRCHL